MVQSLDADCFVAQIFLKPKRLESLGFFAEFRLQNSGIEILLRKLVVQVPHFLKALLDSLVNFYLPFHRLFSFDFEAKVDFLSQLLREGESGREFVEG